MTTRTSGDAASPGGATAAPRTSTTTRTPGSHVDGDRHDEFTAADRGALTQLLRRLHFYAGVLVGPFLLVSALTGFLYALSPAVEPMLHRHETTAASTAQTFRLEDQVAAAQYRHPELTVSGIVVGRPGSTTRVMFADASLPSESYRRAVFVDPSTGQVTGDTVLYGSSQAFPERTWLSEVHRRLHLGEPGRIYSELSASWLAPITLAGLALWWRSRRHGGSSPRARARRVRSTVGATVALGFLFLSATGLTWSKYTGDNITALRAAVGWATPSVTTSLSGVDPAQDPGNSMAGMDMSGMEGMDHAGHTAGTKATTTPAPAPSTSGQPATMLDAAAVHRVGEAAALAGLRAPYEITPAASGKAWSVKETRRSFINPNAVAIDPSNGHITSILDFSRYPFMAKLADWGIRLHMGILFGTLNQLLLAALAACLAVVVVHGYRMWWLRRPTRRDGFAMGRAPLAGALRRLFRARPVPVVLGALAVLALGWAVPLLGTSLLGFLALDLAYQAGRRSA